MLRTAPPTYGVMVVGAEVAERQRLVAIKQQQFYRREYLTVMWVVARLRQRAAVHYTLSFAHDTVAAHR